MSTTPTQDIPEEAAHRITFTVTPLTDAEAQQVIDDIRARFRRKPLIHVIARQPSNTHVLDAPPSAHREDPAVQDQRIEIARALGLADDVVFDLEFLVDSIERLRQSAARDNETAELRAALDAVRAEHEHVYLDEHYRETGRGKALYARCKTCGNLPNGTLDCPTLAAASLRGGQ